MTFSNISDPDELGCERTLPEFYPESIQTQASAVSWGAIVREPQVPPPWR